MLRGSLIISETLYSVGYVVYLKNVQKQKEWLGFKGYKWGVNVAWQGLKIAPKKGGLVYGG